MSDNNKVTSILKMVQDSETEQVQMSLAFDPSPADLPEGTELPASYQLMIDVASGLHAAMTGANEIMAESLDGRALALEDEGAVTVDVDPQKDRTLN